MVILSDLSISFVLNFGIEEVVSSLFKLIE